MLIYPESTNEGITIAVIWQYNFLHGGTPSNNNITPAKVQVSGAAEAVSDCVQTLAWLAATLRFPTHEWLSLSEVTLHHLPSERRGQICFDIHLRDCRRVTLQYPLCWHKLFGQIVVTSGFPIRARDKEGKAVGLEITPSLMVNLAGIVSEAVHGKGLILRGLSSTLIPTKNVQADSGIQWHMFTDDDNLLRSEQVDRFPDWVQTDDILQLFEMRAFLGWCDPATVVLATE